MATNFERGGYGHSDNRLDERGRVILKIMLVKYGTGHTPIKGNKIRTITVENAKVSEIFHVVEDLLFRQPTGDFDPIAMGM